MGNANSSSEHSECLIRPQVGLPDRGSVGNKAGRKEGGHMNVIKRGRGLACSRNKLISCHRLPCGPALENSLATSQPGDSTTEQQGPSWVQAAAPGVAPHVSAVDSENGI